MPISKTGGWWESVQNFLSKFNDPHTQTPSPKQRKPTLHHPAPTMQSGPPQMPEMDAMGIIATSAQRLTLVLLLYNGNWRYIEPYSYRMRKNGSTDMMAFCHRHQHIEAFKPHKIEAAQMTEMGFKPRWPVEIGRQ